jgi:D-beta-D-heptose 7-phosphate kinase / D-beta-D-heptose 1-phosphate adenosyltransferase
MNNREYAQIVEGLGRPRVLIVGDLILDRYVLGEVSRISPEAPIPVLAARANEERLGGAGNVAANLVAMNAQVDVIGIVGEDSSGVVLRELLQKEGIDAAGCVLDRSRPTIQKTRMMSGAHQMLRVDHENVRPLQGETLQAVLAELPERVRRAQAIVLSDYGKGLLTPEVLETAIKAARAAGVPVLVDPKGVDYRRYRGATLVTPNHKEAEQALGRKLTIPGDLPAAADELMALADLDAAVITLGADGIFFKSRTGTEGHVPAFARAVFDVTGAGDTVVAQLGLFLADGVPLENAVYLANQAAAIVVARLGTHAVTQGELRALFNEEPRAEGKVVLAQDLDGVLAGWQREGKRIVFTNGCFDVLHLGHVQYLRFARSKGDVLIVGVNSDESVQRLKGPTRPVNTLEDRMGVLSALEMVDAVTPFGEDTPARIIQRITPHVLVKGEDWADKGVVGREWVEAHGGQVILAPLVPGKSTTSIIERARAGTSS